MVEKKYFVGYLQYGINNYSCLHFVFIRANYNELKKIENKVDMLHERRYNTIKGLRLLIADIDSNINTIR